MTYIPANDSSDGVSKVIYQSKDGTSTKTFDALDCPRQRTAGCKHWPSLPPTSPIKGNPPEAEFAMEFIRLWRSFYSNKSRGLRKKAGTDDAVPALIESFKKSSPGQIRRRRTRICLNAQLHVKKSMLTIKPALVIWIVIGSI